MSISNNVRRDIKGFEKVTHRKVGENKIKNAIYAISGKFALEDDTGVHKIGRKTKEREKLLERDARPGVLDQQNMGRLKSLRRMKEMKERIRLGLLIFCRRNFHTRERT